MSIKIEPIVPEVGKKYYVQLLDVQIPSQPHALIEAEVLSIGDLTITLRLPHPLLRGTYRQGDVVIVENWRPATSD